MAPSKDEQLQGELASSSSDDNIAIDDKKGEVVDSDLPPLPTIEHDLKVGIAEHDLLADPNLDASFRDKVIAALEHGDVAAEKELEQVLLNDSIYPEVAAAVAAVDDPDMPVNTFRAWFLGMLFVIILSGVNQLLSFRYPSVTITGLCVQLVCYPFGVFMAKVLPTRALKTRWGNFSLNPGPFNVKEHTVISIMATVVYQRAYATDLLIVQDLTYGQPAPFGYSILVVLSTQIIGFSFAGFCRRYLVYPAAMIWPATLAYCSLLSTLHHQKQEDTRYMSRQKFFGIAFGVVFFWYFFPGYIFTALSNFAWVTWIAPNNIVVNQLFGTSSGLGMSLISFDWSQINYIGSSPLVTPWFTQANVIFSLVLFFWVCAPAMYYSNVSHSKYLPMSNSHTFDRFGNRFNTSNIITPQGTFDAVKYNNYSAQYLPTVFSISYGLSFASMTATLVHTALFSGKDLIRQFKSSRTEEPDVHARLMKSYKEVPVWWYVATFVVSIVFSIISIEVWDTQMPVWALFIGLLLGAIYTLPIGMIYAVSNIEVGLNVLSEFIIGYARPGKPICMMLFKTYSYISMYQGVSFLQDQKFAHYMKVPPRTVFMSQLLATIVSAFVLLGVQIWALANINGICTPDADDSFICPNTTVIGTASVIWGLIGPKLNYSAHQEYNAFLYFFLVGAIVPIPTWFLAKRYPKSWIRYVNWPVIFTGTGFIPPATAYNYTSWAFVGFLTHKVWRRRNFGSWSRYNYVLSAALDAGTGLSTVFIFFVLIFPASKSTALENWFDGSWWGNLASANTLDSAQASYLSASLTNPFTGTPAELGIGA
ncbi:OPT oligopeptide transporter [Microstroma glucosiphilum]|uniref:OPT oligopeptide transporter n=1 Tax=Pseudomicrostroma glucosiphilum TaxID=1684307 RepID=A0A316UE96_9BASI|nr:OPT oligopeptide transporter [Pseudomicrostroma glucosiphilum]PWN23512.1 OPT oligopeptide transporter [Pseudomicrostroma glucosiphilum]